MRTIQDSGHHLHTRPDITALIDAKWASDPKTYKTRTEVNSFSPVSSQACYTGAFSPIGLESFVEISINEIDLSMCGNSAISTTPELQIEDDIDRIARLSYLFSIKNFTEVQDFLLYKIQLIDVIEEIGKRLNVIFGNAIRHIYLEHFHDPEDHHSGIYIEVDADLSIVNKLGLLDEFDYEYWLNKDFDVRKYITVSV